MKAKRLCFDRILPRELLLPHQSLSQGPGRVSRAIAPRNRQWANGSTIEISFRGGTKAQRDLVKSVAPEWCEFANLELRFTENPAAAIRVSFQPDDGAWSYIGLDNMEVPVDAATMNLGWQDKAVILHEFGHMIGLAHEHQNPAGGIRWNEAAVIADLSGAPNYWSEATIRHNVLDKYRLDQIVGTTFDARSIMLYEFPASWTLDGFGTKANTDLSEQDKGFIASTQMYPGRGKVELPKLPVLAATAAAISHGGEQDSFQFQVSQAGDYVIETGGATDVMLSLYGPDSAAKLVAQDDDSGAGSNARIEASLRPGTYVVQVRHYRSSGTGPYRLWVVG
jgi:hypothetical protein